MTEAGGGGKQKYRQPGCQEDISNVLQDKRSNAVAEREICVALEAIRLVTHFKYLCQLHLLVVKDCMNTMNSLFGLVRSSTLGFLMQDRNQSSDTNTKTYIKNSV